MYIRYNTYNMKCRSLTVFLWLVFLSIKFTACVTKKNIAESPVHTLPQFDIEIKPTLAEVDNLGRIFVVDDHNRIINFKSDLMEQYRYANTKSGLISSVDVTNPLKIVVFYDDFNQVKIIDNTLTIISELNLADKYVDVSACGVTNDGHLWIYDPTQFKLIKISDTGVSVLETSNVNDFGMVNVKITDIREKGNYVILCDRSKGFYFFDNLGQYLFSFEAKDIQSFQFDGRSIYYYTPTGFKSYSLKFKERLLIGVPLDLNKSGLKYILYNAGDFIEVNQNGINVIKSSTKN